MSRQIVMPTPIAPHAVEPVDGTCGLIKCQDCGWCPKGMCRHPKQTVRFVPALVGTWQRCLDFKARA